MDWIGWFKFIICIIHRPHPKRAQPKRPHPKRAQPQRPHSTDRAMKSGGADGSACLVWMCGWYEQEKNMKSNQTNQIFKYSISQLQIIILRYFKMIGWIGLVGSNSQCISYSNRSQSERPQPKRPHPKRPHPKRPHPKRPQSQRAQSQRAQSKRPQPKRPHITPHR